MSAVVEVALDLPLDEPLDYAVPEEMRDKILPGARVLVPLGRRRVIGFCVNRKDSSSHPRLRPVIELLDEAPLVTGELLRLARWMAGYYCCSLGESLAAALPAPVRKARGKRAVEQAAALAVPRDEARQMLERLPPRLARQAEILRLLLGSDGPVPLREIRRRTFARTLSPLHTLEKQGAVVTLALEEPGEETDGCDSPLTLPPPLTVEQSMALSHVEHLLEQKKHRAALVLGVTGSGKTELYLQSIDRCLKTGRKAIVLLPEIALTPQTLARFRERFRRIAVLHSHLSDAQRARQWRRIHEGKADVVIGARSAIFAPLSPLGIVVVDEEHEPTYKQQSVPRYHARDLAIVRARENNAVVLLGSATPSLESYENARSGKYDLLRMTRRVGDRPLPEVEVVDMGREHSECKAFCLLSRKLEQNMRSVLDRGEQVLLFLNRRGYATIVRCKRCGHVASCPRCEISCTFHRGIGRLLCHYCGHEEIPPDSCPECLMPGMKYQGLGTERIEQELERLFPGIPAARMDSDSMQGLGSYEKVLDAFRKGDVRILLGTQMVAKGHDFPSVTLVGIVLADTSLHVPDFRSAERTFQLVAQASGRSGRGKKKGRVVLQTYAADHFALRTGAEQDFLAFAEMELENRKALGYPPYGKLGRIIARSESLEAASRRIAEARRIAVEATRGEATVLGPAPLFRLRGEHRFQLLLKAKEASGVHRGLRAVRREIQNDRSVHLAVDMDPQG